MAGYRELLAIEWEANAVDTFRANFPDVPVFHGDIAAYNPADLGLQPGELDVFDGSPPCQGFSTAGHRQLDDPRNQLFREFIRLLTYWQPKAFVMENVSGMVKGKMRTLFAECLTDLKAAGYVVCVRLLTASYLGVPQARQRLVFIGARNDLGIEPVHPAPFGPVITTSDAIDDLTDLGVVNKMKDKVALLAPHIKPGDGADDVLKAGGKKPSYFSLRRLHADRPAPTILKTPPAFCGYLHPTKNRVLGTNELSRLQSFPDQFDWGGSNYTEIHARIGNSVPPLMMRAIAQTIRERILEPTNQARRTA
jgi:DNA (cytosine-5)-methyltransferase 1